MLTQLAALQSALAARLMLIQEESHKQEQLITKPVVNARSLDPELAGQAEVIQDLAQLGFQGLCRFRF
jgi:hypothetical protein